MDFLALLADTGGGITVNPTDALVYYGVAAPFIGYLLWESRRKDKALEDERARNVDLGKEQLSQAMELGPLLAATAEALRRASRLLAKREATDGDA